MSKWVGWGGGCSDRFVVAGLLGGCVAGVVDGEEGLLMLAHTHALPFGRLEMQYTRVFRQYAS